MAVDGGRGLETKEKKVETKIKTRKTKTIETQAMLNGNDAGLRGLRGVGRDLVRGEGSKGKKV